MVGKSKGLHPNYQFLSTGSFEIWQCNSAIDHYAAHLSFSKRSSLGILSLVLRTAHSLLADNADHAHETEVPESMSFIQSLASALVFTIAIEFAVWLVIIRRDPLKLLWYSFLINSFTNPLMNYIYNYEMRQLYLLELAVAAVEAILIKHLLELGYKEAVILAFAGNLASLLIGLLVFG